MITVGFRAFFIGIALALCAGYATPAQAACGDWLSQGNHQAAQDQPNQQRTAPADAPRRCSGPSCQPSPPQEPRSPLSEGTIVVDKAALTTESLSDLVADAPAGFSKPVSDHWRPSLFRSLLERPPRS